jgi:hypothetical protein
MKKFYISNKEELNAEELRTGCVSYGRIIKRYISDLVLCNEVANIEEFIEGQLYDTYGELEDLAIYQYFLCNLTEFEKETLQEYGILLAYSNKLEVDILCVDHLGTSWDYVMTDVKWTDNWDEM